MGPETVATLVLVAILVLVLALYVFVIALGLRRLSFTLGTIIVGLRAITEQTRPVGPVLTSVLNDVTTIDNNLGGLLTAVGEALGAAPAAATPTMQEAVARARGDAPAEPEFDDFDGAEEDEEELAAAAPAPRARRSPPRRSSAAARSSDGDTVDSAGMRQAVARARQRIATR